MRLFFGLLAIAFAWGAPCFAEGKGYPKNLKQVPLLEDEVHKENIKPEGDPAAPAEGAKTDGNAAVSPPAAKDQLGPRQGWLRDAGRFKVELKTRRKGIDVFLVNASELAPITEESRVEGQLYVGAKEYELKFWPVPGQKKFFAPWPEKLSAHGMEEGKEISLVILPTRERIVGAPVLYKIDHSEIKRE